MITLNQLKIYSRYNGDVDAWARESSNDVLSYHDWEVIEDLVQDLLLVKNHLVSWDYIYRVDKKLNETLASGKEVSYLRSFLKIAESKSNITLLTTIHAPVQRCFDIARDIDVHVASTAHTSERAIAGRTSGLIEFGETVTWRAKHFGIWQNLTSKITEFDSPNYFADEMVTGAFKSFKHKHYFTGDDKQTIMRDEFIFESPLGLLGKLANWLFLKRYMTTLLIKRNLVIKAEAEKVH
jgi:ligand-binding SRPBCC domain-containing protein